MKELAERVAQWQLKALREAKLRTSWFAPDEAYENACREFLFDIVAPQRRDGFLRELPAFAARIARAGAINSFQQTLLRLTSPGVPDLYQGTELWDFSLVDPDNRRPVDFEQRRTWLAEGEEKGPPSEQLTNWRDGRVKLALVRRALALRQHAAALFAQGEYLPLEVEGEHADRVIAFARHAGSAYVIVIASRLAEALLSKDGDVPLVDADRWGDTAVILPDALGSRALFDWLSPAAPKAEGQRLLIAGCACRDAGGAAGRGRRARGLTTPLPWYRNTFIGYPHRRKSGGDTCAKIGVSPAPFDAASPGNEPTST